MQPVTVQFLFDFGSPNTYLCHKLIPALEVRTGAVFEYVPILLGGLFKLANNRAPMEAFAEIRHRPIPLHRFRHAYLPLVGQWFRYQDRP